MSKAIIITTEGAISDVEIDGLDSMQAAVGGRVEAVGLHDRPDVTSYVNEEGKWECPPNWRATALMRPYLVPGDVICGPFLLVGFNAAAGTHKDLPAEMREKVAVTDGA